MAVQIEPLSIRLAPITTPSPWLSQPHPMRSGETLLAVPHLATTPTHGLRVSHGDSWIDIFGGYVGVGHLVVVPFLRYDCHRSTWQRPDRQHTRVGSHQRSMHDLLVQRYPRP